MRTQMRYFRERGQCLHRDSLAKGWGECIRYVEIGDDRYAVRQVEVFGNDRVLRYDRSHWCDKFGQLFGCLFSQKQKAINGRRTAVVITRNEFEKIWRKAYHSSMCEKQLEHSLTAERGAAPSWLQNS